MSSSQVYRNNVDYSSQQVRDADARARAKIYLLRVMIPRATCPNPAAKRAWSAVRALGSDLSLPLPITQVVRTTARVLIAFAKKDEK